MDKFFFENRDGINLCFGLLIGIIPSLWDIRNVKDGKNPGEKKYYFKNSGIIFIIVIILFVIFSARMLWIEKNILKEENVYVEFSLRPNQMYLDYNKLSEILPKEIHPSMIQIKDYEVRGDFFLDLSHPSKAKGFSTIFAYYKCYLHIQNKTNKNELIMVNDIDYKDIRIYLSIEEIINKGFSLDSNPKLFIRGKEYEGDKFIKNGEISF